MGTNHEIFVEREHNGVVKSISVQDMIKSICYAKWAEKTIESYGKEVKDLYILLVCYPGWTQEERNAYLTEYKQEIIDAFGSVHTDYIDNLHVTVGYNGNAIHYGPTDFITIRSAITKQLGIELEQIA